MTGTLDVPLAEDAVVAEGGLRLATSRSQRLVELGRVAHDAHSPPAATRSRLHHEWEADLPGLARGDDRHAGLVGHALGLQLVAPRTQRLGRRPDPGQVCRIHSLCEVRALRQEAVTGMDRVRAGLLRAANVLLGEEVTSDLCRLVGRPRVQRATVIRRDDRDGRDTELTARAKDA